jgi:hypothetical protein
MRLYFRVSKGDPTFSYHQSQLLTDGLFIPFYWGNSPEDAPNLVFGSCLGRASAKKKKALLFPMSYPLFD